MTDLSIFAQTKRSKAEELRAAYARIAQLEADLSALIDECLDQQPSTAENPNEDAYQRGKFDGVMEFAKAILALKTRAHP